LSQAVQWQASKTPSEIIAAREEMISQIEFAAAELRESGKNAHWFSQCDAVMKQVCEGVNGFLFQELLWASQHCDLEVVELFRQGVSAALCPGSVCLPAVMCGRGAHAWGAGVQRRWGAGVRRPGQEHRDPKGMSM
jgi:hypothetical protein